MALNESAVVQAAVEILERYGLGDLSMRRVADQLGVQPGALYYHVPNKQTLLAKVADHLLAGLQEICDARAWANAFRARLLDHRDAAELVSSSLATGLLSHHPAHHLSIAPGIAAALTHFVLGHVYQEQQRAQFHALGVADAPAATEHVFAYGVDALLAG